MLPLSLCTSSARDIWYRVSNVRDLQQTNTKICRLTLCEPTFFDARTRGCGGCGGRGDARTRGMRGDAFLFFSLKRKEAKETFARIGSCRYPIIQLNFYSFLSKVNTPRTLRTEECYLIIRLFSERLSDIFSNLSLSICLKFPLNPRGKFSPAFFKRR